MLLIKAQLESNDSSEIQFTSSTPFISDGQTAFGIFSSKNLGDSIQRRRKRHRLVGDWTGGWSHWDKEIKTERKQETHVRKEGKYKTGRRQKKGREPPPVGEKKRERINHKALKEPTAMKAKEGLEVTHGKREEPDTIQVTVSALSTISGRQFSKGKQSAMKNLRGRAEQSNTREREEWKARGQVKRA